MTTEELKTLERNCPHCARNLEQEIELITGECTSDDCLRYDKLTNEPETLKG